VALKVLASAVRPGWWALAAMAVELQEVARLSKSLAGPDCKWMVHEIG
jgi:hypothetical protein